MKTKKSFRNLWIGSALVRALIVAFPVLTGVAVAIYWPVITTWPNSIWHWTLVSPFWIASIAIFLFYVGVFLRTLAGGWEGYIAHTWWYRIGNPISKIARRIFKRRIKEEKKTAGLEWPGRIIYYLGILLFVANFFFIAYHHEWLKILLIVLGGCALIALELFILVKASDHLKNKLVNILFVVFPLTMIYYLDFFIFSWKRPYISLAVIGLAIVVIIIAFAYRRLKRIRKAAKEKRESEKQAEKERLAAEKTKAHFEELQKLGLYELFLGYVRCKKAGQQKEATLIIQAYTGLRLDGGASLHGEEKISILRKIRTINFNVDKELFILIAMDYDDDCEVMLLTHTNEPLNRDGLYDNLPILFKYSDQKKEIITKFIGKEIRENNFFNSIKKDFRLPEYIQVINALIFSYKKEWKDWEMLVSLITAIKTLLDIGVKGVEEIWDKQLTENLHGFLKLLEKRFQEEGIQVPFPSIPDILKDENDESPVV